MPGNFSSRIPHQSLKNIVSSHMSSFSVSQLHRLCTPSAFLAFPIITCAVTASNTTNDHRVEEWGLPPRLVSNAFRPQHPGFGSFGQVESEPPLPMPQVVYLFTSPKPGHTAYITDDPMGIPRPPEFRSTNWTYMCSSGWFVLS